MIERSVIWASPPKIEKSAGFSATLVARSKWTTFDSDALAAFCFWRRLISSAGVGKSESPDLADACAPLSASDGLVAAEGSSPEPRSAGFERDGLGLSVGLLGFFSGVAAGGRSGGVAGYLSGVAGAAGGGVCASGSSSARTAATARPIESAAITARRVVFMRCVSGTAE
jgi:hypothetical protein